MNKKSIIRSLIIFLFMAVLFTNNAFASFDQIFMTSQNGSTDIRTTYDLNETPWLYLKLPESSLNFTGAWWNDPDNNAHFVSQGPTTDQEIWLSLLDWSTVKEAGQWNVNAFYSAANGAYGTGSTSFTVTPEPLSSLLFIVGGATLACRCSLKSRKRP